MKEDIGRETKDRKEWQVSMEEKIAAAEYKDAVEVKPTDPEIQNKINQIEKQLAGWSTSTPGASTGPSTIVWGGFDKDGDGAAEIEWVESSVEQLGLVAPASTYFKGEKFEGMLFCKFQKASEACKALDALSKIKLKYGSKEVRCKLDAPIEERVPLSLLLGLRWQLGEWGFDKKRHQGGRRSPRHDDHGWQTSGVCRGQEGSY